MNPFCFKAHLNLTLILILVMALIEPEYVRTHLLLYFCFKARLHEKRLPSALE